MGMPRLRMQAPVGDADTKGDAGPTRVAGGVAGRFMRMGARMEQTRRELLAVGEVLVEVLEPAGAQLAREMQNHLQRLVCKVAVVGQIKAGKSSFVNALVGRPDFLPTDLNPSTSAITQLHFNQSSPSGDAAVFHFFTQADWRELASGSGLLRELTQRLVPGFEPALLRQNVFALISRAESRLGSDYERLLGRAHAFATIEPGVLRRYVCAGDVVPDGDAGLYSEITELADLYLDGGPFDFPVTLVDTPGTNDPFLIRDEVTRRALDTADAYIVVLSAHQPLSDGDVSLLRILRGLHKERIVVFVNRIDEIEDRQAGLPDLVAFVRDRLALEFPGFEIPIVVGSARFGGEAGHAVSAGPSAREVGTLDGERAGEEEGAEGTGMAAMRAAIDVLLANTHSAYVMRQVARCYAEMAQSCIAAARHEQAGITRAAAPDAASGEQAEEELRRLVNEQQSLLMTRGVLDRVPRNLEAKLYQILWDALRSQRERLAQIVDGHARFERNSLVATMRARRSGRRWTCDVASLRRALEGEFASGFEDCVAKLLEHTARIVDYLNPVFEILIPGTALPTPPSGRDAGVIQMPSPASLGRPLALDLDVSWWARFWQSQPTAGERGAAIEQLIKEEFHPIAESLAGSQMEVLQDYVRSTTHWTAFVCNNIIQALERRHERLTAYLEELRENIETQGRDAIARQQQEALAEVEQRLRVASSAADRLAIATETIEAWFDPTKRSPK